MKGHKDSSGNFHPHSNQSSVVHASDVHGSRTKLKKIKEMTSVRGFHRGDYVTANSLNGRVGKIVKFIVDKDRPDDPRALIVTTFHHDGTGKTLPVDFLEHAQKGGRPNKYGYVEKNGVTNLHLSKRAKDTIEENKKIFHEKRKELIKKYVGKNVKFTVGEGTSYNPKKTIYGRIIDVENDSGGMLGSPKIYATVRDSDGEVWTPTIDKLSST